MYIWKTFMEENILNLGVEDSQRSDSTKCELTSKDCETYEEISHHDWDKSEIRLARLLILELSSRESKILMKDMFEEI